MALALPALHARSGFSNEPWFLARGMESRAGVDLLAGVRSDNAALSIYTIVHATDGQPALAPKHLPALIDYAKRLASDPRVAQVDSPVTLRQGLGLAQYAALYADPEQALRDQPAIAESYVSRGHSSVLFELTPAERHRRGRHRAAGARSAPQRAGRALQRAWSAATLPTTTTSATRCSGAFRWYSAS